MFVAISEATYILSNQEATHGAASMLFIVYWAISHSLYIYKVCKYIEESVLLIKMIYRHKNKTVNSYQRLLDRN